MMDTNLLGDPVQHGKLFSYHSFFCMCAYVCVCVEKYVRRPTTVTLIQSAII